MLKSVSTNIDNSQTEDVATQRTENGMSSSMTTENGMNYTKARELISLLTVRRTVPKIGMRNFL